MRTESSRLRRSLLNEGREGWPRQREQHVQRPQRKRKHTTERTADPESPDSKGLVLQAEAGGRRAHTTRGHVKDHGKVGWAPLFLPPSTANALNVYTEQASERWREEDRSERGLGTQGVTPR